MHLKRSQAIRGLPIPRKGAKYIARARNHVYSSIPVVIAIRDMLGLAKTAREVKQIIKKGLIKINGRNVKDIRDPINIFSIFEADKKYRLIYLNTGRFSFEEFSGNDRLCKVINKKILNDGKIQINLHDGTNLISKEKVSVGDSLLLETNGKIKEIIPVKRGKKAIVISGKSIGMSGEVGDVKGNKVTIYLENKERGVKLDKKHIIVR